MWRPTMVAVARLRSTGAAESHQSAAALSSSAGQLLTRALVKRVIHRCWSSPLDLLAANHMFDQMSSAWPRPYARYFNLLRSKTLKSGHPLAALSFHSRMVHGAGVPPNSYAFGISIHCCAHLGAPDLAFGFLSDMFKRCCKVNAAIVSGLLDGLFAEGRLADALEVLNKMPDMGCAPDVVLHSRILCWCCEFREVSLGEGVVCRMLKQGDCVDTLFWTILIDGLCGEGRIGDAVKVFDKMPNTGCAPDVIAYGSLIDNLCRLGRVDLVLGLICHMLRRGFQPNNITVNSIIDGLCKMNLVFEAVALFKKMPKMGILADEITYTSLIDCFCSLGYLEIGLGFFSDFMKHGHQISTAMLSSVIHGHCEALRIDGASSIFGAMQEMGCAPSSVTYGVLIDCCHRLGNIDVGYGLLCSMLKQGIQVRTPIWNILIHGICMANGLPDDAAQLIARMNKIGCEPDVITYGILIKFLCQNQGVDQALELHKKMSKWGSFCQPNVVTYTTIIGRLLKEGRLDEASKLLEEMADERIYPTSINYRNDINIFSSLPKMTDKT